jgi:hypothetical protein
MNFEAYQNKQETKKEALDDDWGRRIVELGSFNDFEYLEGDKNSREQEKAAFLRGDVTEPNLDYPKLQDFDFQQKEAGLLKLKSDVLALEKDAVVRQAYRWKINEKIAEVRMLKAAREGDDRRFGKYNNYIYGEPDSEIFKYTLQKVIKTAERVQGSEQEMVAGAARRILQEFAGFSTETTLSKENLGAEKLKSLKDEGEFSSYEIAWAFHGALHEFAESGWRVTKDAGGSSTAVHVSQEKKEVVVPEGRQVKVSKLMALIAHEIGTHVARMENGKRSRLKLLEIGLDRSLKGEEGIARYEEQKILGANDFAGFDGHLAISLARGVDGKKRTFREVFNILRDYNFINSKKEIHEAWNSAQDSAWKWCVRTFRGSSCTAPGVCFNKDIVYREGNIGVWNVINDDPEEEKRFSIGKYDPSNPRHIWILEQLGVSDEDLHILETLD